MICIKATNNTGPLCSCHIRFESEFVLKGYYFVKGHMRITVSQVCRVSNSVCFSCPVTFATQ